MFSFFSYQHFLSVLCIYICRANNVIRFFLYYIVIHSVSTLCAFIFLCNYVIYIYLLESVFLLIFWLVLVSSCSTVLVFFNSLYLISFYHTYFLFLIFSRSYMFKLCDFSSIESYNLRSCVKSTLFLHVF